MGKKEWTNKSEKLFADIKKYGPRKGKSFGKEFKRRNYFTKHYAWAVPNKTASNGGKSFFMTKNLDINPETKEKTIFYKPVKQEEVLKTLDVNCNIINPKFDYKYWESTNDLSSYKLKSLTKEQQLKRKRYLYTTMKEFIGEIIKSGKIKTYSKIVYYPFLKRKGVPDLQQMFNIFGGFPLEEEEIEDPTEANATSCVLPGGQATQSIIDFEKSLFYKHLKSEFFNDNLDELNHFLDHIADMIQDPAKLKDTAHLFQSIQGTGKGLLGLWIMSLLGSSNCVTISNIKRYFDNSFNTHTSHKILKIFEEIAEKGAAHSNHNKLKAEITAKSEDVEPKGLDAFTVPNCARMWFFTNNENSLYIESDDRRYTLHKLNDKYAQNLEYFKPIVKELENKSFLKASFEYFAERNYDPTNVRKVFNTQYKNEQKEANLSNGILFIKDLIENNYWKTKNDEGKIKGKYITNIFKQWNERNGTKFNMKSFKTQVKRIGVELKTLRIKNKKPFKGYDLNASKIEKHFKKLLNNSDFKFELLDNDDEIDEIDFEFEC